MRICFHGTNKMSARQILRTGFQPGTYFAAHLEDALAFGGPFVFEVRFKRAPSDWQFHTARRIPIKQIRSLTHYAPRHIYGKNLAEIFSGYRKEREQSKARRKSAIAA